MGRDKTTNQISIDEIFDRYNKGEITDPELTFHVVTYQNSIIDDLGMILLSNFAEEERGVPYS